MPASTVASTNRPEYEVPSPALEAGRFASIEANMGSLGYLQCRQNGAMAD